MKKHLTTAIGVVLVFSVVKYTEKKQGTTKI